MGNAAGAIVLEFQDTSYDDARRGWDTVCRAVTRCVLPLLGRPVQANCSRDLDETKFVAVSSPGNMNELGSITVFGRSSGVFKGQENYKHTTRECIDESLRRDVFWTAKEATARVSYVTSPKNDEYLAWVVLAVIMLICVVAASDVCQRQLRRRRGQNPPPATVTPT